MELNTLNIRLSVVIVNYNVKDFLQQCLLSVQDALKNIPSEIIVVDNHSKDASCQMIKEHFKDVILIDNKKNVGFSKANNQGVAMAQGKYVLILNPDTVVAEDTFTKILDFAEKQKNLGVLGVKLIDGTGKFLPESKRGIPTPSIALSKILGFPKNKLNIYYANTINENEIAQVPILVGAFMLIKTSVYKEVNGFDEDYFMYGEDIDLSYKILKKGYSNFYFGKTVTLHYKGESTTKNNVYLKRFYGAMEIFYSKHFKVNPFSKIVMKTGITIWKLIKSTTLKTKKNTPDKSINRYIYIGKNDVTFSKIKTKLKPELAVFHQGISIKDILSNNVDTLIFDTNYFSYKEIFNLMQALKNTKISYRFVPKNTRFLIGSDSNENKGEIIYF